MAKQITRIVYTATDGIWVGQYYVKHRGQRVYLPAWASTRLRETFHTPDTYKVKFTVVDESEAHYRVETDGRYHALYTNANGFYSPWGKYSHQACFLPKTWNHLFVRRSVTYGN